jgi:hypothetical protein
MEGRKEGRREGGKLRKIGGGGLRGEQVFYFRHFKFVYKDY